MVDIDLDKGQPALGGVLFCQLGKDGRNGTARRTPVGVKVNDDVRGRGENGIKLRGRADLGDLFRRLRDR